MERGASRYCNHWQFWNREIKFYQHNQRVSVHYILLFFLHSPKNATSCSERLSDDHDPLKCRWCTEQLSVSSSSCMWSRKQKLPIFHCLRSNFLAWEFLYRAHELRVFCMKSSLVWWMPRMWSKAEIYRWLEVRHQPFAVLLWARIELFGQLKGFWNCLWSVLRIMNSYRAVPKI